MKHNASTLSRNVRNVWGKSVKDGGQSASWIRQAKMRRVRRFAKVTIYRGEDAAARLLQGEL